MMVGLLDMHTILGDLVSCRRCNAVGRDGTWSVCTIHMLLHLNRLHEPH